VDLKYQQIIVDCAAIWLGEGTNPTHQTSSEYFRAELVRNLELVVAGVCPTIE